MKKFELKAVKYVDFKSEETHCFEATLYVDGKRFCKVSNDGHGGCNDYQMLTIGDSWDEFNTRLKQINDDLGQELITTKIKNPETGEPVTIKNDLDMVVGDLMNFYLIKKEIKRITRKITYVNNGVLHSVAKHKPTELNLKMVQQAPWWKPDFVIFNTMPEKAQIALLETIS